MHAPECRSATVPPPLLWLSREVLRARIAEPGRVWNERDTRRIWTLNQAEVVVRRAQLGENFARL